MAALRALRSKRESSPWLASVREHLEGSIGAQQSRLSLWQPDSTVESELMESCPVSYPALALTCQQPLAPRGPATSLSNTTIRT